jgi:hypothetical protein
LILIKSVESLAATAGNQRLPTISEFIFDLMNYSGSPDAAKAGATAILMARPVNTSSSVRSGRETSFVRDPL